MTIDPVSLWPLFWSVLVICVTVYLVRHPWRDR